MVKYPEGCKKSAGGAATFYGADIMDDPASDGDQPLTIVEGEIDKLAVETAGNPFVVSVPDGAPRRCCCLVSGDRESRPPTWVGQRQRWCCSAAG